MSVCLSGSLVYSFRNFSFSFFFFLFPVGTINYFQHLCEVMFIFMFLPHWQLHFGRGQVNTGTWLAILDYFEIVYF